MVFFSGAAYNATCTGANKGDCAETNNICVAGTLKCACATDAFRKDTTECATSKIVFKEFILPKKSRFIFKAMFNINT